MSQRLRCVFIPAGAPAYAWVAPIQFHEALTPVGSSIWIKTGAAKPTFSGMPTDSATTADVGADLNKRRNLIRSVRGIEPPSRF
jgi:hypothetical protein